MADKSHTYSIHSDNDCRTGIPSNSLTRFLNAGGGGDPCPEGKYYTVQPYMYFWGQLPPWGKSY